MVRKTTTMFAFAAALAATAFTGCAALNGMRPQDLTVSGHEQAAVAEEENAAQAAREAQSGGGRGAQYAHFMAARYRSLVESHRAAARHLRDEVARACDGIPEAAAGAAIAGAEVVSVGEIRKGDEPPVVHSARGFDPEYLLGAKMTLKGEVDPSALTGQLRCRVARAAAHGDDGLDPVAVKGARFKVLPRDKGGVLVEIRADDRSTAAEVVRRAQLLAAP
jgi:hypothetical protein